MVGRSLQRIHGKSPQKAIPVEIVEGPVAGRVEVFAMWRYSRQREKGLLTRSAKLSGRSAEKDACKELCAAQKTIPKKKRAQSRNGEHPEKDRTARATAPFASRQSRRSRERNGTDTLYDCQYTGTRDTPNLTSSAFCTNVINRIHYQTTQEITKRRGSKRPICILSDGCYFEAPERSKYFRKSDCGLRTMVVPPCPRA